MFKYNNWRSVLYSNGCMYFLLSLLLLDVKEERRKGASQNDEWVENSSALRIQILVVRARFFIKRVLKYFKLVDRRLSHWNRRKMLTSDWWLFCCKVTIWTEKRLCYSHKKEQCWPINKYFFNERWLMKSAIKSDYIWWIDVWSLGSSLEGWKLYGLLNYSNFNLYTIRCSYRLDYRMTLLWWLEWWVCRRYVNQPVENLTEIIINAWK